MDAEPIAHFLCIEDLPLQRGGEFLCYAFIGGEKYPVLRYENKDALMINAHGGEHLMPPKFLTRYFRRVEDKES